MFFSFRDCRVPHFILSFPFHRWNIQNFGKHPLRMRRPTHPLVWKLPGWKHRIVCSSDKPYRHDFPRRGESSCFLDVCKRLSFPTPSFVHIVAYLQLIFRPERSFFTLPYFWPSHFYTNTFWFRLPTGGSSFFEKRQFTLIKRCKYIKFIYLEVNYECTVSNQSRC